MAEHNVEVWGKPYSVTTYQKSKTVWVAAGTYMGKRFESKGRTESAALRGWKDAARYRGN